MKLDAPTMLSSGRSLLTLLSEASLEILQQGTNAYSVVKQPLLALSTLRQFSSKSNKPKNKHVKDKKQSLRQQAAVDSAALQQQPSRGQRKDNRSSSSSSSNLGKSIPQPAALSLPKLSMPAIGRVLPSSRAAAAAAAALLTSQQQSKAMTPPGPRARTPAQAAAAAAPAIPKQHASRRPGTRRKRSQAAAVMVDSTSSHSMEQKLLDDASSDDEEAAAVAASFARLVPRQQVLPWEVVDSLPQSSPFKLEVMGSAAAGINTYVAYLKATRMGMPSVFDLGLVREQGRQARRHLLQREQLLQALVHFLHRDNSSSLMGQLDLLQQQQEHHQQQQQQQQASVPGANSWQPSDTQLQELSQQQLEAAAAVAAASGSPLLAGVKGGNVTDCLVDYFVFKRCMEALLAQRQHRCAMKSKHHTLLTAYQQQYEQEHGQGAAAPPVLTLLKPSELAEVKIWDAFFDATLEDYVAYLEAASMGQPSVLTTSNAAVQAPSKQQQQQHAQKDHHQATEEYQEACKAMAIAATILSMLPKQLQRRPGAMTALQLVQLAVVADEDSPDNVVDILEAFYGIKRQGFTDVLEELLTAAGMEAAGTRGRF